MDIEPEVELTEEERRAKEKKVLEIKKMIALQSLQPMMNMSISDAVYSNGSSGIGSELNGNSSHLFSCFNPTNSGNYSDYNYEREKRAREQVACRRFSLLILVSFTYLKRFALSCLI